MTTRAFTRSAPDAHRAELQQLLDRWAAAIVANDPVRIAEFAEPDWILITTESGAIPLDRFLAVVANGSLSHSEMTFEVMDVRTYGDVAVVIAHGINSGTWEGAPFSADELVTDVFVRSSGTWTCSVSALTPRIPST